MERNDSDLSSLMDGGRSQSILRASSPQTQREPIASPAKPPSGPPPGKVKRMKERTEDYWQQHRYEDSQGSYFTGSSSYYYTDEESEKDEQVAFNETKRPTTAAFITKPVLVNNDNMDLSIDSLRGSRSPSIASPQKMPPPPPKVTPNRRASEDDLSFTETEDEMLNFSESSIAPVVKSAPTPPPKPSKKTETDSELAFSDEDSLELSPSPPPAKKSSVSPAAKRKSNDSSDLVFTEDTTTPAERALPVAAQSATSLVFTELTSSTNPTPTATAAKISLAGKNSVVTARRSSVEDELQFTEELSVAGDDDDLAFSMVSDYPPSRRVSISAVAARLSPSTPNQAARSKEVPAKVVKPDADDDPVHFSIESSSRVASTSPGSALHFSMTDTTALTTDLATGDTDSDQEDMMKSEATRAFDMHTPSPTLSPVEREENDARRITQCEESLEFLARVEEPFFRFVWVVQAEEIALCGHMYSWRQRLECVSVEEEETSVRQEISQISQSSEWASIVMKTTPFKSDVLTRRHLQLREPFIAEEATARQSLEYKIRQDLVVVTALYDEKVERTAISQEERSVRTQIQSDCIREVELRLQEAAARASARSWEELLVGHQAREEEQRDRIVVDESYQSEVIYMDAIQVLESDFRLALDQEFDNYVHLVEVELGHLFQVQEVQVIELRARTSFESDALQSFLSTQVLEIDSFVKKEFSFEATLTMPRVQLEAPCWRVWPTIGPR